MIDKGGAFVGFAIIVEVSPCNDIAVPIAIHIPAQATETPSLAPAWLLSIVATEVAIDPCRRAMINKGGPFIGFAVVVVPRPYNDIAVPIPVHIPCAGYGPAHLCVHAWLLSIVVAAADTQASGRTVVNKGGPFIGLAIGVTK
jgi:hypothetical protein